jgi:hypothetical protein
MRTGSTRGNSAAIRPTAALSGDNGSSRSTDRRNSLGRSVRANELFRGGESGCHDPLLRRTLGGILREIDISESEIAEFIDSKDQVTIEGSTKKYVEVSCERFPDLRFGVGNRATPGSIRIIRKAADAGRVACQWTLSGDLSLILPMHGLDLVGTLTPPNSGSRAPDRIDFATFSESLRTRHSGDISSAGPASNERLRTSPVFPASDPGGSKLFLTKVRKNSLSNLFPSSEKHAGIEFPLKLAHLYYQKGALRAQLDLPKLVFRQSSAGLLMSFDRLSLSMDENENSINLRGGRLWKSRKD